MMRALRRLPLPRRLLLAPPPLMSLQR